MDKKNRTLFVTLLSTEQGIKLKLDLEKKGFQFSSPPHTLFAAKNSGLSCTLYTSGKCVIQGKETEEFVTFYLEPEILKELALNSLGEARIGVDEAGKGDFFGPLCIAGVYASKEQLPLLQQIGVKDSKNLKDSTIITMGQKIEKVFPHAVIVLFPTKYNEIYKKFGNLNYLLGWAHACVIENLANKTGAKHAIIDQFAHEKVVSSALEKKGISLFLEQRHKGESDPVVAAASILARKAFVEGIDKLSREYHLKLPKGASSQVIDAGLSFARTKGEENLGSVCKLHFRTLDQILARIAK